MISISHRVQRIKNSAAVKGVAHWLSDLTPYAPVSTVTPSAASKSKGLPSVDEFKCEVRAQRMRKRVLESSLPHLLQRSR